MADITRRTVLRDGGVIAAGAVVGGAVIGSATPAVAVGAKTAADRTAQPTEQGWTPRTPRLTTPWTADVSPTNAHPEYPRPQLVRDRWVNLNGVWQFAALAAGARPTPGADLDERVLVPYPIESALSGIMRHEDRMSYRRRVVVPTSWDVGPDRKNRLVLNFDAVDFSAEVLVNGTSVATHDGGYDRFSVDVTDELRCDARGRAAGEQEIIVIAEDPTEDGVQPLGKQRVGAIDPAAPHSSLYYTPASGIWQTVWMEPVPAVHVDDIVIAPDVDGEQVVCTVSVTGDSRRLVKLVVRRGRVPVAVAVGLPGSATTLRVRRPELWSPENPFLYELDVQVLGDGNDSVSGYFAMREVAVAEIGGVPRMLLNGRPLPQLSCLQQGFWPDGIYTAATDDALRFDVEQAKALGYNTIRKHQKTEPDRWYHWADVLGVLVWQDMPATATGRQPPNQATPSQPPADGKVEFERELDRVIRQLRAFPSIVMWIPFNEGWGAYDLARIAAHVKELDPTRIVNEMSGTTTANYAEGGGDVLDWHNLGTHEPGPVPPTDDGRAAVIGEFGAFAYAVAGHEWLPGGSDPNQVVSGAAELTDQYATALGKVAGFVRDRGLSGANYNLFEDAELQVNGLFTYDRRVFKADDRARVTAANRAVIAIENELA